MKFENWYVWFSKTYTVNSKHNKSKTKYNWMQYKLETAGRVAAWYANNPGAKITPEIIQSVFNGFYPTIN